LFFTQKICSFACTVRGGGAGEREACLRAPCTEEYCEPRPKRTLLESPIEESGEVVRIAPQLAFSESLGLFPGRREDSDGGSSCSASCCAGFASSENAVG
jgi:hypothetical protein